MLKRAGAGGVAGGVAGGGARRGQHPAGPPRKHRHERLLTDWRAHGTDTDDSPWVRGRETAPAQRADTLSDRHAQRGAGECPQAQVPHASARVGARRERHSTVPPHERRR
ncbi:hypothetical protein GCM10027203_30710 [Nonomuraea fastidiosa]